MKKKETVFSRILGNREINTRAARLASLLLLAAALVLLWIPYEQRVFFFFTRSSTLLKPDLLSSLFALALILPLYIRRIFHFDRVSLYQIISFTLRFTLTASFCRILMGSHLMEGIWTLLAACLITLSWFGIRSLGPLVWGIFLLVSFANLMMANSIMGFMGYACITCALLGFILGERESLRHWGGHLYQEFRGE